MHSLPNETEKAMELNIITASDPLWKSVQEYARACSWRAGKSLAGMMESERFSDWERVLAAVDNGTIAGYCTVQKTDCIPDLPYTPFIASLFVGEPYRGKRLSQKLIDAAMDYLGSVGFTEVYLLSDHENFYEKYGFQVIGRQTAPWGEIQKVYRKSIS